MSLLADEDSCSIRVHLREDIGKCKYKVIVVLHIYNKKFGIRLAGHPENKNKSVVVRLF